MKQDLKVNSCLTLLLDAAGSGVANARYGQRHLLDFTRVQLIAPQVEHVAGSADESNLSGCSTR